MGFMFDLMLKAFCLYNYIHFSIIVKMEAEWKKRTVCVIQHIAEIEYKISS